MVTATAGVGIGRAAAQQLALGALRPHRAAAAPPPRRCPEAGGQQPFAKTAEIRIPSGRAGPSVAGAVGVSISSR